MHRSTLIALFLALASLPFPLSAHNNLFFAGDAFFSTRFPLQEERSDESDTAIHFGYESFSGHFLACGYLGHGGLDVVDRDGLLRRRLAELRDTLAAHHADASLYDLGDALDDGDTNRFFPLYVYGRDFPVETLPLALRYNEYWAEEQHGCSDVLYGGIVRVDSEAEVTNGMEDLFDPYLMILEMKHAIAVPPLPTEAAAKLDTLAARNRADEERGKECFEEWGTVHAGAADVMLVVPLFTPEFIAELYASGSTSYIINRLPTALALREEGVVLYVVTVEGVRRVLIGSRK
jgi:hypothetical protein